MAASGLGLSTSFLPGHDTLLRRRRRPVAGSVASSLRPVTAELGRQLVEAVGVGLPCTVMSCGDVIYRSTLPQADGLTVTAPGAALALAAVSYLWATPGVAPGFFDMFVLAFAERLFRPAFRKVIPLSSTRAGSFSLLDRFVLIRFACAGRLRAREEAWRGRVWRRVQGLAGQPRSG
jgi:hypothetical protein